MVIVKEQHDEEAERNSYSNPPPFEIPEINYPAPGLGWLKGINDGHTLNVSLLDGSRNVGKANPEDCSKLRCG